MKRTLLFAAGGIAAAIAVLLFAWGATVAMRQIDALYGPAAAIASFTVFMGAMAGVVLEWMLRR